MLYEARLNAEGQPEWLTGVGSFDDAVATISMIRGGSVDVGDEMLCSYLGCGRAVVSDRAFPTFFTELTQLSTVDGVSSCAPPEAAIVLPAGGTLVNSTSARSRR